MGELPGIGHAKLERYGEQFLTVLNSLEDEENVAT